MEGYIKRTPQGRRHAECHRKLGLKPPLEPRNSCCNGVTFDDDLSDRQQFSRS